MCLFTSVFSSSNTFFAEYSELRLYVVSEDMFTTVKYEEIEVRAHGCFLYGRKPGRWFDMTAHVQ